MKFKILGLLLCLNFSFNSYAQNNSNEFKNIIGPFPQIGSLEEKQDIDELLFYQKNRTAEQCAAAELEAHATLEIFYGGKNGLLSPEELKRIQKKFRWLTAKTGSIVFYYKTKYHRPRPYLTHTEIKPCIDLEKSKSYPSGHTALARVYAHALSIIFPERSALFMQRADQVAKNRILGGVHHPSDVAAGKRLADSIAEKYLSDNDSIYELVNLSN